MGIDFFNILPKSPNVLTRRQGHSPDHNPRLNPNPNYNRKTIFSIWKETIFTTLIICASSSLQQPAGLLYMIPRTQCKQTSPILTHTDPLGHCTRHVTHQTKQSALTITRKYNIVQPIRCLSVVCLSIATRVYCDKMAEVRNVYCNKTTDMLSVCLSVLLDTSVL